MPMRLSCGRFDRAESDYRTSRRGLELGPELPGAAEQDPVLNGEGTVETF